MASLAYISVPPCATRLQSPSQSLQRAKKVTTPLPNATSQLSAPSTSTQTQTGMNTSAAAAFSLLPQMLLSSTLPNVPSSPSAKDKEKEKDTRKGPQLLTTKEPLSIPVTTANFKRFVAKVGPIFWMLNRIEEVILWKRGWRVTGVWMAAYAFFCYFPKMVFAIPHLALIGIMLASYPYTKAKTGETSSTDSVNWQGNLQGIQNLMGSVADAHDLVQPYLHLIVLTAAHLPSPTCADVIVPPNTSSYPPLILLTLLLTFPPLIALLTSPLFPTRCVCLVVGLLPLVATHPRVLPILPTLGKLAVSLTQNVLVVLVRRYAELRRTILTLWTRIKRKGKRDALFHTGEIDVDLPPLLTMLERMRDNDRMDDTCWNAELREVELFENERFVPSRSSRPAINPIHPPTYPTDRPTSPTLVSSFSGIPAPVVTSQGHRFSLPPTPLPGGTSNAPPDPTDPGWSKAHLRSDERRGWTRGQDGWGGVRSRSRAGSGESQGKGRVGDGREKAEERDGIDLDTGEGVVSSNLTFSLAAGWAFVGTEGWRRDLGRKWAGEGVGVDPDADGWVYTNDAWGCALGIPYPGSVTRRRRWVRRIWYDGVGEGTGVEVKAKAKETGMGLRI